MAEERKGEERTRSRSAAATAPSPSSDTLPPQKGILSGLRRNKRRASSSCSSASSIRLPNPNLSDCHVCGIRIGSNRGKNKLQTLDSQWRIVLVCETCLINIKSGKICSYCFMEISGVGGVRCCHCKCIVHEGCVSKYRGFSLGSSFTCVDCWVPKSLSKVRKRKSKTPNVGSKNVTDACSVKSSSVSLADEGTAKSLEDLVRDANASAETKVAAAARAREKALNKAVVARKAAEVAQNALKLLTERQKAQVKDCPVSRDSVVDDEKLALRLHRIMNSSPRISRNSGSVSEGQMVSNKMVRHNDSLVRGSGGCASCCEEIEIPGIENPDNSFSEPSVSISLMDHDSCNGMGIVKGRKIADTGETPQIDEHKETIEDIVMGNTGRGMEAGNVSGIEIDEVVPPLREEQASCSNKESTSCGDTKSMNSGHGSCKNLEGLEQKASLQREICSQSIHEGYTTCPDRYSLKYSKRCSQSIHKGDISGPDRYLLKYSKRCSQSIHEGDPSGPDRYLIKYSKRRSNIKAIFPSKAKLLNENYTLKSQDSASGLPLLQQNCSEASMTCSDASFQSSTTPLQASACTNGTSGC